MTNTETPTVTPDPDRDGVILHLPEITYLDTQTWAVNVGLTPEGLAALRAALEAAVMEPPADRADEGVTPPPALTEEGRLRAQVEVLQQDAERDQGLAKVGARCMREGHQGLIESGRAVIEGHRFALSVALGLGTGAPWDAIHERVKELRRMADETPTAERPACPHCGLPHDLTPSMELACASIRASISDRDAADDEPAAETQPKSCAHCGKDILRITGTLAAWWVHDPGGNTVCHPEQAASSTRATPAAAERQDGAQSSPPPA